MQSKLKRSHREDKRARQIERARQLEMAVQQSSGAANGISLTPSDGDSEAFAHPRLGRGLAAAARLKALRSESKG